MAKYVYNDGNRNISRCVSVKIRCNKASFRLIIYAGTKSSRFFCPPSFTILFSFCYYARNTLHCLLPEGHVPTTARNTCASRWTASWRRHTPYTRSSCRTTARQTAPWPCCACCACACATAPPCYPPTSTRPRLARRHQGLLLPLHLRMALLAV